MTPDERYQPPAASSLGWGGLPDVETTPNADPVASTQDGSSYGTGTPLEVNDKGPGQQGTSGHAPGDGKMVCNVGAVTVNFYANPDNPDKAPAPSSDTAALEVVQTAIIALASYVLNPDQAARPEPGNTVARPRQPESTKVIGIHKGKLARNNDPTHDPTRRRTNTPSKYGKLITILLLAGCLISGSRGYQDEFQKSAGDPKVSASAGTLSLLGSIGGFVGIGD